MIGDIKGGAAGVSGAEKGGDGGGIRGLAATGNRAGLLKRVVPKAYQVASDTEKLSVNSFAPGTQEHDHYNSGWDHAVGVGTRTPAQRVHPIFQQGVVNGLAWRRRNPADF